MNYTDPTKIFSSRNEDKAKMSTFENITGNRKILDEYLEAKVICNTGEDAFKHTEKIKKDENIKLSTYIRQNGLLNTPK